MTHIQPPQQPTGDINSRNIRGAIYIASVILNLAAILSKPVLPEWTDTLTEAAQFLATVAGGTALLSMVGQKEMK